MPFTVKTNSEEETYLLGKKLGKNLKSGDIIALFGTLGAGKTAFTRGIAANFGCEDDVSSPTFALVNEYRAKEIKIYHFDMYRIHGSDELYCTGFFDYIEEENVIAIIEWSENIEDSLPSQTIKIRIDKDGENARVFSFEGVDEL